VALAALALLSLSGHVHAAVPANPAPASSNPCAPAPVTGVLAATVRRLGKVDLHFFGALGAPVAFYECVGARAVALGVRTGPPGALTSLFAGTRWHCARLTRRFAATTTLPGGAFARGTSGVRTRSCAQRLELELARRVARGRQAAIRIVDRWGTGELRAKLCVTSPRARRACREIVFKSAEATLTRHFRATTRGRWSVELLVHRHRVRGSVAVGVRGIPTRPARSTVLATGDSTMGGIDNFLADDLGDSATLVSDVRLGFAISRADAWQRIARSQMARLAPAATVVSIGANEGWPMRAADGADHECCDAAWLEAYTERLRAVMRTYRRQGRARVLWLTIPAPRDRVRVPIFSAVNAAIVRAAQGVAGVRVLRMDLLFSPQGFRDVMRHKGRDVRVREPDGIHLSVAGTKIAAEAVAAELRRR